MPVQALQKLRSFASFSLAAAFDCSSLKPLPLTASRHFDLAFMCARY